MADKVSSCKYQTRIKLFQHVIRRFSDLVGSASTSSALKLNRNSATDVCCVNNVIRSRLPKTGFVGLELYTGGRGPMMV
ncbi:hypothetical protein J6590_038442 [Homalodisca vitripennis]|nr:hypothetical protein J6590_038442 [Homalodisca vitripennis]